MASYGTSCITLYSTSIAQYIYTGNPSSILRPLDNKHYPPTLREREMESASSKQLFASLLIVLAICSYMNSSSAAASNKLSSDFIAISVALPSSRSTHNARINEKASTASDFPLLGRRLRRGYYGPSHPNPGTYIPAIASTLKNHKGAPSSISAFISPSENYKAAPSSVSFV